MDVNFDVICIGAALIDMVARVERHPKEDDEVFVSDLKILSGGAAANTAYACAKLGLRSAFLGKIGDNDIFGRKIIQDFKEVNVNTSLLKFTKKYGTGSAYVALNQAADRRIYAHSGAANYLTKEDINDEELSSTKAIFLSSLKNLEPFIKAANIGKKNDIPVVLNPGMLIIDQGLDIIIHLLEKVDILILSQNEFQSLFNLKSIILKKELIQQEIKSLFALKIKVIIITLGKRGALIYTENESELISQIAIEQVVDTTGAGDAFSAGFIYGFVQTLSFKFNELKEHVKLGNYVAGKCIQKLGARNGIPSGKLLKNSFPHLK